MTRTLPLVPPPEMALTPSQDEPPHPWGDPSGWWVEEPPSDQNASAEPVGVESLHGAATAVAVTFGGDGAVADAVVVVVAAAAVVAPRVVGDVRVVQ